MSKMILVTGGARSGKSTFAEETVKKFGENVLYIATSISFDDEMKDRIKKHKEQRPHEWETLEAFKDFDIVLPDRIVGKSAALIDCITIMVTNIMLETDLNWTNINVDDISNIENEVKNEITKLIYTIKKSETPFVLVTNEVGMGIVPENKMARAFRDMAGRANQMLARASDEVYLCVSGIPVKIK